MEVFPKHHCCRFPHLLGILASPRCPPPAPPVDEVVAGHIPQAQLETRFQSPTLFVLTAGSLRATCPPQALIGGRLKADPLDKHGVGQGQQSPALGLLEDNAASALQDPCPSS